VLSNNVNDWHNNVAAVYITCMFDTTASWSPTKFVVSCVLPHQGRALSGEDTSTMETGVLQLQVWSCGTAFQLICDNL